MQGQERDREVRINRRIRVPEVTVIGSDGSPLGVKPTQEALRLAQEEGLDLVEVNPRSMPPTCRLLDYGKYKYLQSKKAAASKATRVETKEIQVAPKISPNDLAYRIEWAKGFIAEGHHVRVVCSFKGREIIHKEIGLTHLHAFVDALKDVALVEQAPQLMGRQLMLQLRKK